MHLYAAMTQNAAITAVGLSTRERRGIRALDSEIGLAARAHLYTAMTWNVATSAAGLSTRERRAAPASSAHSHCLDTGTCRQQMVQLIGTMRVEPGVLPLPAAPTATALTQAPAGSKWLN
eukprot:504023-Pelagomonas_calceolata.AAC.2